MSAGPTSCSTTFLADARSQQTATGVKLIVQIVIFDFPDRSCASASQSGEFTVANNGVANYKTFLNAISAIISGQNFLLACAQCRLMLSLDYSDVRVVIIFEPKSLVNLVVNLNVAKCSSAASAYLSLTQYALATLTQCNVWLYLDGGNGGVLGWQANIARRSHSLYSWIS